jgi:MoxR-like ATPase
MTTNTNVCRVPELNPEYVEFGNFEMIEKFIRSDAFFPIWLTGPAGVGKTSIIEQACAKAGRKFIRVNFTNETSEDDLIGSFRLVTAKDEYGNDLPTTVTEFHEGAVVTALREGAVLVLDEIDAGHTNKVLCLQSVLEGKGVFIKPTGEWVNPAKGFTVFATSNTQGRGNDEGRYAGTNIMNTAFLDRYKGMMHFDYPDEKTEQEILLNYFTKFATESSTWGNLLNSMSTDESKNFSVAAVKWFETLIKWANAVRANYNDGVASETITTRTLINIVHGFSILIDQDVAVELACSRFDSENKDAMMKYYQSFKKSPDAEVKKEEVEVDDGFAKWEPTK